MTFGIAPAFLAYQLVLTQLGQIGVGITLFYRIGAVRLARFNAIQSEWPTFVGLPVPAAAIGLLMSIWFMSPWLLAISTCILAWLMVSYIEFLHYKKRKVDEEGRIPWCSLIS